MNYYINLFSPETADAFDKSDRSTSGFRISRKSYVENQKIGVGDRFICYYTKIQRFIGILEISGKPFIDHTPIFLSKDDPFILRFKVKPIVWLPLENSIPIHTDEIWNTLSFTKKLSKDSTNWTYMVFSSPREWPNKECIFLEKKLISQSKTKEVYPFSERDLKRLKSSKIKISGEKEVFVSIPDDFTDQPIAPAQNKRDQRESIKAQAELAHIGEKLGYKIWLPKGDRSRILQIWKADQDSLLNELPLLFEDTTLKTIQNIDLVWIRKRSIVRAFEVEDTTSIYSGILRMADLLSLQPMLNIPIHIVAPSSRREAVFHQLKRPVFAVMETGPLSERCSYISYDSVFELSREKRLAHMNDTVLDEFAEYAADE